MTPPLTYRHYGRNRRTLGALAVAAVVLLFLHSIGTMTWILVLLSLFAAPALVDVLLNPVSTFEFSEGILRWKSATQTAEIPTDQIRSARFDTRLDVSIRVTLTMVNGSKVRIPNDVLPSHKIFEAALKDCDIPVERHHFRVI